MRLEAGHVKARAAELGFDLCGIARAGALDPEPLRRWLSNGWAADLGYMRERLDERLDPRRLLEGAASVIIVAAGYGPAPGEPEPPPDALVVARYARRRDYHNALLKPLRKLAAWLRARGARAYAEVDAGAVAEKAWAQRAGLGWIGKNGCLINERWGSWLLLGALVTDLALEPDAEHPDRCGDCRLCIPACPTGAIPEPRFVDARRCLAYHTIEHRGPIPEDVAARAGGRVFGCDACQDVCPWNRRAAPVKLVSLRVKPELVALRGVLELTEASARARFEGTPLMRAGRDGLVRSALAVAPSPRAQAERLRRDPSPGVRIEAGRALDRQGW